MTLQGMMQQLQSSPHQHGCLTGPGFAIEEAAEETVEAGIMASSAGSAGSEGTRRQEIARDSRQGVIGRAIWAQSNRVLGVGVEEIWLQQNKAINTPHTMRLASLRQLGADAVVTYTVAVHRGVCPHPNARSFVVLEPSGRAANMWEAWT
ncbi:hypothetical protein PSPO01_08173 [Paraphaeosphaeria sporulosa]